MRRRDAGHDVAALALRDQIIPPTLNLENPDEFATGVDIVSGAARPTIIDYAISNGFGFGGVNASILLTLRDTVTSDLQVKSLCFILTELILKSNPLLLTAPIFLYGAFSDPGFQPVEGTVPEYSGNGRLSNNPSVLGL